MRQGIVPDETGRRIRERVCPRCGIAARPAGKFALHIIRSHAAVGPLMAVGAQNAATIGVVQQHKIMDELVFVLVSRARQKCTSPRRRCLPSHRQTFGRNCGFLDDVNDMLEHARLAGAFGDGFKRFHFRAVAILPVPKAGNVNRPARFG